MCKTIYRSEFWHPLHNTNAGTIKSPPLKHTAVSASFSAAKKLKELERANIAFKSKVDIRDKQSYLLNDRIKIISQKMFQPCLSWETENPCKFFIYKGLSSSSCTQTGSNRDGSESTGV